MVWRCRKPKARYRRLRQWHRWFAWFPVRVPTKGRMSGMHMVWWTHVLRKGSDTSWSGEPEWEWSYASIPAGTVEERIGDLCRNLNELQDGVKKMRKKNPGVTGS